MADRCDDDEDTVTGWGPRRRSPGDSALEAIVLLAGGYTSAKDVRIRMRVLAALRTRSSRRVR